MVRDWCLAVLLALLALVPMAARADAPASGTKVLYLYDDFTLNRTPQAMSTSAGAIVPGVHRNPAYADWTLTPAIPAGKSVTLSAGTVTVNLAVACGIPAADAANAGSYCLSWGRNRVAVELRSGNTSLGTSAYDFVPYSASRSVQNISRTITLAAPVTIPSGQSLVLRVINDGENDYWHGDLRVFQYNGSPSKFSFGTSTVVNVDSVNVYSAPYPATSTKAFYGPNQNIYVRAVVSDPFGSYDVSGARLTLTDDANVVRAADNAMTQVADSGAATRTFEWTFKLPVSLAEGYWKARVTGVEGLESPAVTHSLDATFGVGVPRLGLSKSHTGSFPAGGSGSYSLVVKNNGAALGGTTTVVDVLPTGLTYVPAGSGGSGWTCGAAGQTVTCTSTSAIAANGTLPALTINVAVSNTAPTSVVNTATIANSTLDGGVAHDGDADFTLIGRPDLSTSALTVLDVNGGDVLPGDTLRYSLTVTDSGGAPVTGVSVGADVPGHVHGLVVDAPPGTVDASTTSGGANGTGHVAVSGISVPANGSVTIRFEVVVDAGTTAGTTLAAGGTVSNPSGPGATPAARTLVVSQSQVANAGNKLLYVYDNSQLTRTPQSIANSSGFLIVGIPNNDGSHDWSLTPAIPTGKSLVLPAGSATVALTMACDTSQFACVEWARNRVSVQLLNGSTVLGTSAITEFFHTDPQQKTFTVPLASGTTIPAGGRLVLRVINGGANGFNRPGIRVYQAYAGQRSTVSFTTSTVVNVDSVSVYSAPYPSTATKTLYSPGDTVYIRSVISDPFGSQDVSRADITLTDPNGVPIQLLDAQMTQVADSGAATRTFEYAYTLPGNAAAGYWSTGVTGHEGTEGTVTHTANAAFQLKVTPLTATLSHLGNFVAGGNGTYRVVVHSSGGATSGTTTVTGTLPSGLTYSGASGSGWSCTAVGQDVSCTTTQSVGAGNDFPALGLNVAIAFAAVGTVDFSVVVSNPAVDGGVPYTSPVDTASVALPASSFVVLDTNGGDVTPGDTLQYKLTLYNNTAAPVTGVGFDVDLPAHVTAFSLGGTPPGSSPLFTAGAGANATGHLAVSGISIPAFGSAIVLYNVDVSGAALPNDSIASTALVSNGPVSSLPAATLRVSTSLVPASGNKILYLTDARTLTRARPAASTTAGYTILTPNGNNSETSADWVLVPAVAAGKQLVLSAGTIGFNLVMACANDLNPCTDQLMNRVTLDLLVNGSVVASSPAQQFYNMDPQPKPFNITLGSARVLAAGDTIGLRIRNSGSQEWNRNGLKIYQYYGTHSTMSFDTPTVVNVDSVQAYSAAYPSTATKAFYATGETVYLRAVVSDPFGGADVSGARLTLTDAGGTVRLPNGSMARKSAARSNSVS